MENDYNIYVRSNLFATKTIFTQAGPIAVIADSSASLVNFSKATISVYSKLGAIIF